MPWNVFDEHSRGGMHIRMELPCQDASLCRKEDNWCMAAVADGHGSRRHFRSGIGAKLACEAASECIGRMMQRLGNASVPQEEDIDRLKQDILARWREMVMDHQARCIWKIEELMEQMEVLKPQDYQALLDGDAPLIPYGSTLLAEFAGAGFWCALQLGDGGFATLETDGSIRWPMPESRINCGRFTASLAMAEPMPEFFHCMDTQFPAGLMIYSDGVEKAFPAHGAELAGYLHAAWCTMRSGREDDRAALCGAVRRLAEQGRAQDDVSLAGLVDSAADRAALRLDRRQCEEEIRRLQAQLEECRAAVVFNRQQLENLERTGQENSDAVKQIRTILRRKEDQLQQLTERMEMLSRNMPEPVDEETYPPEEGDYLDL